MKEIFSSKIFKATAIFVVIVALVTTAVNVTIAFFTDAKESTGVFTAGNVYISLTEAAIKSDGNGNLIRDPDADRIQGSELGGYEMNFVLKLITSRSSILYRRFRCNSHRHRCLN